MLYQRLICVTQVVIEHRCVRAHDPFVVLLVGRNKLALARPIGLRGIQMNLGLVRQSAGGVALRCPNLVLAGLERHLRHHRGVHLAHQLHRLRIVEIGPQHLGHFPFVVAGSDHRTERPQDMKMPVALITVGRRCVERDDIREIELAKRLFGPADADLHHLVRCLAMVDRQNAVEQEFGALLR